VPKLRISPLAEADFYSIGIYTLRTWGEAQADRYLNGIDDCCRLLADNPGLGRSCDQIRPGLHRMEHGKHVVFYRPEAGGILVCRILHQRMLPETQDIDADD
jgi:toxin ParE1/3/4